MKEQTAAFLYNSDGNHAFQFSKCNKIIEYRKLLYYVIISSHTAYKYLETGITQQTSTPLIGHVCMQLFVT